MVLEDVTELCVDWLTSEAAESGFRKTRLSRTLLNGNNIVAVRTC